MTPLANSAEGALAEAILCCGGAGFESAFWGFLRRTTNADNLVILAYLTSGPPMVLSHYASERRVFAQLEALYLAGAYLLDPFHELHLTQAPSGAYRLAEVAPDAFFRSRYYDEYLRQTTILDEVNIIARPRHGVTLAIALARDATSGALFAPKDVQTCHRIAPVIAALAERHWAELPASAATAPDIATDVAQVLLERLDIRLSPRQAEVALLILRGHSTLAIALRLKISPQTVKVFRRQLYARCRISSQAELFGLLLPVLAYLA
ncbi:MAG: helix-turn-helix transcriptional regulator [Paracoccaceae bacterium]